MPSHQRYCCICKNYSGKIVDGKKISMHRFPADVRARKVWMQRCKDARPNFLFVNYDQTRLCSCHFVGKSGPQKNPLPCIFPGPDGEEKIYKLSFYQSYFMIVYYFQVMTDCDNHEVPRVESEFESELIEAPLSPVEASAGILMDFSDSVIDISLKFHDYTGNTVTPLKRKRHHSVQIQQDMVMSSTQTEEVIISN
ncbi:hypothetical protein ScPMuIL_003121 [Solemya velum]